MRAFFAGLLLLAGCSTSYDIRTKPDGVKLYVGDKQMGTTPFALSSGDAPKSEAGGVLARLEIEGYQRVFVWLPDDGKRYDLTFNMTPFFRRARDESVVGDLEIDRIDLYRLSERLLDLQTDLLAGTQTAKNPAAEELKRLIDANPTMGSMHFLEALRLLREGKKDEGKLVLKTALRFAPSEFDFLSLMNELGGDANAAKPTP